MLPRNSADCARLPPANEMMSSRSPRWRFATLFGHGSPTGGASRFRNRTAELYVRTETFVGLASNLLCCAKALLAIA